MKPASGNIAFTARTSDSKTYFKTATGTSLVASKLYTNITVGSMVELALGNVFCSDGSVYDTKDAATTAGKTPVAKIAYLGNDAETNVFYKHGLALALQDADVSDTKMWCNQTSATCLGTQYNSSTKYTDMAGIDNTDALVNHTGHTKHNAARAARNFKYDESVAEGTHPTGTSAWFLLSAGQWGKMKGAQGLGLNNLGLQGNAVYWSATESTANYAYYIATSSGYCDTGSKSGGHWVRACLAF